MKKLGTALLAFLAVLLHGCLMTVFGFFGGEGVLWVCSKIFPFFSEFFNLLGILWILLSVLALIITVIYGIFASIVVFKEVK